MDKKIQFITKYLVEKAAREIEKRGIPKKNEGKKYLVNVNGKKFPFKLLITEAAKLSGIKLNTKEFGSSPANRKGFEEITGYKCEPIVKDDKISKTFKEIIEELKNILIQENGVISGSNFHKTTTNYVWINDADNIIGNKKKHIMK